ncbi:MAG TPA: hypothetical protein VG267_15375 [Terracidiphilus sp.]|jgi:hypothetical protein|nr:hypothetical protein [Terracidiphilus sp.]
MEYTNAVISSAATTASDGAIPRSIAGYPASASEKRKPASVSDLLAHNKIPSLDNAQMADLLQHLFRFSDQTERIQVAEAVYRHDHVNPRALDIFLACTLPLAERSARRRAYKSFVYPSDWQLECMYDGAVTAAIAVFQRNSAVGEGSDAFRRYLFRALALGTVRSYFRRAENDGIQTVADLATIPTCQRPLHNQAEQDIITRDLLNQVTGFPNLRPHVCATLQCIQALGPDEALKEHAQTESGDPDKWKRERGRRPILNPNAIAKAMGTDRYTVHTNLREARIILRSVFNADGKLFLSH